MLLPEALFRPFVKTYFLEVNMFRTVRKDKQKLTFEWTLQFPSAFLGLAWLSLVIFSFPLSLPSISVATHVVLPTVRSRIRIAFRKSRELQEDHIDTGYKITLVCFWRLIMWGSSQANEHFYGWRVNQSTNPSTLISQFMLNFLGFYTFYWFLYFSLGFPIKTGISY